MFKNEKYINKSYATLSNMAELLQELREKEKVEVICEENSLNFSLLKDFFKFRMRGFNNTEIAQKLGVHRVTVQRYTSTLQKLKESEFNLLHKYILRGKNETNN